MFPPTPILAEEVWPMAIISYLKADPQQEPHLPGFEEVPPVGEPSPYSDVALVHKA